MTVASHHDFFNARLSRSDFKRLGSFIQSQTGIKMPENKIVMVEARLRKRLRSLSLPSYKDYCDYLFSPEGMKKELAQLIDVITTNKTEFFREPDHFDCLCKAVLPDLLGKRYRRLSIWSAACSTGEEPYSIAMTLDDFLNNHPEYQFDFTILATDISIDVLNKAHRAVYDQKLVIHMPSGFKNSYLLKSKNSKKGLVRIVPDIRKKVQFRRFNLLNDELQVKKNMHIIFCRNVIIYFGRKEQEVLLNRLCMCLAPGGYLFMGHSEVLASLDLPLYSIAPTVYKKAD